MRNLVFALSKASKEFKKPDKPRPPKVAIVGIRKESGYLYYVDKDGDIARTPAGQNNKLAQLKTTIKSIEKKLKNLKTDSKEYKEVKKRVKELKDKVKAYQ